MTHTFADTKETVLRREVERCERELRGGDWSERQRVALACRILAQNGHDSGLAGQITSKESEGRFLTQAMGRGLGEISASNLLSVDEDLNVIAGEGIPNPANRFHAWVYRARADVRCVVHTHPLHTSALSMLGVPLAISHMDTCLLYEDVSFVEHWSGVPVGNEEGMTISAALAEKSAVLLAHHGLVVVGRTVEEACLRALQFERAAQLQLLAMSAGAIRTLHPERAREARRWLGGRARVRATFAHHARRVLERAPECLDEGDAE